MSALPGHAVDALRDGAPRGMRSETAMSLAVSMVNGGLDWQDFHAALTDPRNGLSDWALRRANGTPRQAHDTYVRLDRTWRKAQAFVATSPPVANRREVLQVVGEMRAEADLREWPGRGGIRDREVYCALLGLATERATLTPSVSVRTLTEMTSFRGWKTICRALDSLVAQGVLQRIAPGSGDQPGRYRLVPACVSDRHISSHAELGGTDVSLRDGGATGSAGSEEREWPLAPLSRGRTRLGLVLGAHAAAVHAALVDEFPVPVAAIVSRSGASRATVYRWLPRLARLGLAREAPGGWMATSLDPERVAFEHDVPLIEEDRHLRHELARSGYRQARETGREQWVRQREAAVARSRAARKRWTSKKS